MKLAPSVATTQAERKLLRSHRHGNVCNGGLPAQLQDIVTMIQLRRVNNKEGKLGPQ